ncbi:hypothetical protein H8E77_38290 [bacterium]|nr:hypothetical protein [bacterium]
MMKNLDERFKVPPAECRPLQIVHCFEDLGTTNEQIEDGLRKLQRLGIGGIVCNVGWNTEPQKHSGPLCVAQEALEHPDRYLVSEEAWAIFLLGVKKAPEMGFRVWLYDEEGYPSGAAGGLTLKNHPEYQARGIFALRREGNGPGAVTIALPEDAEKFVYAHIYPLKDGDISIQGSKPVGFTTTCIEAKGVEGQWVLMAFAEKMMFEGTHSQHNVFSERKYINILNADAVKRFIRLTHDAYAQTLKDALPRNIDAIFTDEPSLMVCYLNTPREFKYAVIPWEDSLAERFKEKHGYDLRANLYALFGGASEREMHIRHHFYQTVSDMVAYNYFELINVWCEEHGIDSSGHLLLEERIIQHVAFSGDLMACLRQMQAPGVDMLTSKPERILKDGWFMSPKYAGSVACITGRQVVMSETSGHIETATRVCYTLPEMIGTANLQYLLGVNTITSYYPWSRFYSDIETDENQDPIYTKDNYVKYNEYVGRLGVVLKGATHAADIALYYPVESVQAYFLPSTKALVTETQHPAAQCMQARLYDITLDLLCNSWDFDFLDARAVLDAQIGNGTLNISAGKYKAVIMPSMKIIPGNVLSKLQEFEERDGILIWAGELPDLGASEDEDAIVKQRMQQYQSNQLMDALNKQLIRKLDIEKSPAEANIFVGHYLRGEKDIYFLVNVEPTDVKVTVRMRRKKRIKVYNPSDGVISESDLPVKVLIPGYGGVFIIDK